MVGRTITDEVGCFNTLMNLLNEVNEVNKLKLITETCYRSMMHARRYLIYRSIMMLDIKHYYTTVYQAS
jgi:hypothetical protein